MKQFAEDFILKDSKKDVIKAVKEDNIDFIKNYLKENGSVSFQIEDDIEHPTLLFFAQSAQMVNLLIKHGVNKSVKNSFICHSNTALHYAISTQAPVAAIAAMVKAGVGFKFDFNEKIDIRNDRKSTPLLLALEKRNLPAVQAILKYEPDLYVKDINGNTPYHHVCAWERSLTQTYKRTDGAMVSIVPVEVNNIRRKLEMMGADTGSINNFGQTAADYASCVSGMPTPRRRVTRQTPIRQTNKQKQMQ